MIGRTAWVSRRVTYQFGSCVATKLADWEYIKKIQHSLKHNNINQALRYLVNSYLDGQILDIHAFRNFYMKIHETNASITYEQIVYKLYRQSFKPHILLLDWMNSLARSNNQSIINLLKNDYKMLSLEMPNVQKIKQQDEDRRTIQKFAQSKITDIKQPPILNKELPKNATKVQTKAQTKTKIQKMAQRLQKTIIEGLTYSLQQIQLLKSHNINTQNRTDISKLVGTVLQNNPNIIIHNVEVTYGSSFDQFDDTQMQYNSTVINNSQYQQFNNTNRHQEYEEQQQDDDEQDDEGQQYGNDQHIKNIKIGRIQIIPNKVIQYAKQPDSSNIGNSDKK